MNSTAITEEASYVQYNSCFCFLALSLFVFRLFFGSGSSVHLLHDAGEASSSQLFPRRGRLGQLTACQNQLRETSIKPAAPQGNQNALTQSVQPGNPTSKRPVDSPRISRPGRPCYNYLIIRSCPLPKQKLIEKKKSQVWILRRDVPRLQHLPRQTAGRSLRSKRRREMHGSGRANGP